MLSRSKAAILCVSLGPEVAAEIFKHLPDDIIEPLTVEMARTRNVDSTVAGDVLEEVVETAYARGYIAEGGVAYARDVLERAVGAAKASDILSRLAAAIETTPFEFLRRTHPDQVWAFLRNEHPQTIALVIANLHTHEFAAKVMKLIPNELQAEIAARIATMSQTSPEIVKEVARLVKLKLDAVVQHEYAVAGGVHALASILNAADRAVERNILEHLETSAPAVADEVRALLFVFEDILKLDDRSIQLVLKEVDAKDLALALRGASEEVAERILANMSQRGAEMLREEMEFMPPQRRPVIEEAQTKIVAAVRRLEDAGEILISRGEAADDLLL
ncbi:MAG: flagellar motor switch protein FliG [Gaiellales bacterium]